MNCDAEAQAKQGVYNMINQKENRATAPGLLPCSRLRRALNDTILALDRCQRKWLAAIGLWAAAAEPARLFRPTCKGPRAS